MPEKSYNNHKKFKLHLTLVTFLSSDEIFTIIIPMSQWENRVTSWLASLPEIIHGSCGTS